MPIRLTGTAMVGIRVARRRAEEQVHHDHDQHEGFEQRHDHLVDRVHARRSSCRRGPDAHALGEARRTARPACAAARPRPAPRWRRATGRCRWSPPAGRSAGSRCPWPAAPSSTRATSRTRSSEPSGLARMTMSPNCSGVTRRPSVWMLIWNCWSSEIGCAPMRPTAAWMFWLLDRRDDVGRRQVQVGQPVDLEPDAHGVVHRAEQVHLPDARRAREAVDHVDGGVVAEEQRRVGRVRGAQRDELQHRGGLLAHDQAGPLHLLRQPGECSPGCGC